jgi:glycogen operon protein
MAKGGSPRFCRARALSHTLGVEFDGEGSNFALFSDHATRVELILFDPGGKTETFRADLPEMKGGIWHGYLSGIAPGQVYGYRVHGPWAPEEGHRFNPAKLLLDPYAREIRGELAWNGAVFGHRIGEDDRIRDDRDSAPFMPKAVVADPVFDWEADLALDTPWEQVVIYEAHVRGLTKLHPDVDESVRGTFRALGSDAVIGHLTALGVTTLELMPVHGFVHDLHMLEKGLSNYWGYNTLSFFSAHPGYLSSGQVREVKTAIRRLHEAGIEVVLDVVYNHTAEGNELGPTLSFRGIDNASYYMLSRENPRHCYDTTGTGNALNLAHPMVLRLVLDSLRYWVQVMHVDGFRFDLASTLGRGESGFDHRGSFFAAIRQDPVLRRVKLIAEPWDIADGGYRLGGFPWPFREWNDKFRDDLRRFWRGDPGLLPRLSQRLVGSPRQFDHDHRPATSSINFVTAHDGFTLRDLVSYAAARNQANGEEGRDGHSENHSANFGADGPADDPAVEAMRLRRAKALMATLLLSQGVPMILAGDERGNTQGGNNNAWCQDNETGWLDWARDCPELGQAIRDLIRFRMSPGLVQPGFARNTAGARNPEVRWLHPRGGGMTDDDWKDGELRLLGLWLLPKGHASSLMIFNAGGDATFALPRGPWRRVLNSAAKSVGCDEPAKGQVAIEAQSVGVLIPDRGSA